MRILFGSDVFNDCLADSGYETEYEQGIGLLLR